MSQMHHERKRTTQVGRELFLLGNAPLTLKWDESYSCWGAFGTRNVKGSLDILMRDQIFFTLKRDFLSRVLVAFSHFTIIRLSQNLN